MAAAIRDDCLQFPLALERNRHILDDLHTLEVQLSLDQLTDVIVHCRTQHLARTDNQGDLETKTAESLCHLDPDVSPAEDNRLPGSLLGKKTMESQSRFEGSQAKHTVQVRAFQQKARQSERRWL